MAICKKCDRVYADKFEACPRCEPKRSLKGAFGGVIFLSLVIAGAVAALSPNKVEAPEKIAVDRCQGFILQRLNDPGSAEFDQTSLNMPASKNEDGTYSALIELRAKNAFGAMMKAQYWCTARPGATGTDDWTPVSVIQTNE